MKVYLLLRDEHGSDPNTTIEGVFATQEAADEERMLEEEKDSSGSVYVEEREVQA